MPGVQSLHQSSENNSKAEFIMGHFFQCIGLLVGHPLSSLFCVPLLARIHLGTKTTNRDKRTLFDKAIAMLNFLPQDISYLVADAYYSTRKMLLGAAKKGMYLIVKVKLNAVAYFPPKQRCKGTRGRPPLYGLKVKLVDLFSDLAQFIEMDSPVYGENGVKILCRSINLLSRTLGGMELQYILVIHPIRGRMILLTSNLNVDPLDVIRVYGYRFKIEVTFKAAIYNVGAFLYRFWMRTMDKTRLRDKTKHLHKKSEEYRELYFRKLLAYELMFK